MVAYGVWERIVEGLTGALGGLFSTSTQDSIQRALGALEFPVLEFSGPSLQLYSLSQGVSLVTAALVSVWYVILVIHYATKAAVIEAAKVLPLIAIIGAYLPWLAEVATVAVHNFAVGFVEWQTDYLYADELFPFDVGTPFGFFDGVFALLGANILNWMFSIFTSALPGVMAALIIVFSFRWFGAFGDGLFTLVVGVAVMLILGPLASLVVMAFFWPYLVVNSVTGGGVAFTLLIASLAPFALFFLYFITGASRKVRGAMESRQLSNKVGRMSSEPDAGTGSTLAKAAAGGVVGAAVANYLGNRSKREGDPEEEGKSRPIRGAIIGAASVVAKKHPVTAAMMFAATSAVPKGRSNAPDAQKAAGTGAPVADDSARQSSAAEQPRAPQSTAAKGEKTIIKPKQAISAYREHMAKPDREPWKTEVLQANLRSVGIDPDNVVEPDDDTGKER